MSSLKASLLATAIVPTASFVYFVFFNLVLGVSLEHALGAAFSYARFALVVTLPVGALLGGLLNALVKPPGKRNRLLLALPIGFLAGLLCVLLMELRLSGFQHFSWPLRRPADVFVAVGLPMWLFAGLVSYVLALFLSRNRAGA